MVVGGVEISIISDLRWQSHDDLVVLVYDLLEFIFLGAEW